MQGYHSYEVCFGLGLVVALVATPLVMRLARWAGAVSKPQHRRAHARPIPLWGGVAVFVGMWTPLLLLLCYDNQVAQQLQVRWSTLALIFGAGLLMLGVGMLDDYGGLNAFKKFAIQVPVALGLIGAGVYFRGITVPGVGSFDLGPLGPLLSFLWLVGVTNAINLIDGMDGLAAGTTLFVAATNALIAVLYGHVLLAVVMASLAGACLGFLRYNFNPARIYLGDAGSLCLGMTLATSSLLCSAKGTVAASLLVPAVALGYPVLDTLVSMARRAVRGKSMFSGDRGHIHHRLLGRGLSQRQTVLVLYGVCTLFCVLALAMVFEHRIGIAAGLAVLLVNLACGARTLGYTDAVRRLLGRHPRTNEVRRRFQLAHHTGELFKARLELASSPAAVRELLRQACAELGLAGVEITLPARPVVGAPFAGPGSALGVGFEAGQPADDHPELYLSGANGHGFGGLNGNGSLRHDQYVHDKSGLQVRVFYHARPDPEDLLLEHRMRMGEVVAVAHRRWEALTKELRGPARARAILGSAALVQWLPGLSRRWT